MNAVPTIELNDGHRIPQLGFGTWQIAPDAAERAVSAALEVGYRHVDTAQMYKNERGVGDAVRSSGLDRSDVFITTKLDNRFHRPDDARRSFEQSLVDLQVDDVDLFLIHWPLPTLFDGDFVTTWRTLEEFKRDGRARSIGVSNFTPVQLQRLAEGAEIVPAVNQVEMHPYFLNDDVRVYGEAQGIRTESWSPLALGAVLGDAEVAEVAREVGRTPAQVVVRWHIDRGVIVFPKSTTPSRIAENFKVFDFELSPGQVQRISALDRGEEGRTGPHPDVFDEQPD